jgi:hypothetical protein
MRCSPRLLPALAFAWCAGLFAPLPAATTDDLQVGVPASLAPWVSWVLDGRDRRACALGPGAEVAQICAWPGPLALELDAECGRFAQSWHLAAEDWVPLPGADGAWPQRVTGDGAPLAVVEHDGRPAVRLRPGTYRLSGTFARPRRPELLALPPETGLVTLRLDGTAVARPRRDGEGRLWLGVDAVPEPAPEAAPDTLSLEVTRRIEDGVPLQVRTRLALDVSGRAVS